MFRYQNSKNDSGYSFKINENSFLMIFYNDLVYPNKVISLEFKHNKSKIKELSEVFSNKYVKFIGVKAEDLDDSSNSKDSFNSSINKSIASNKYTPYTTQNSSKSKQQFQNPSNKSTINPNQSIPLNNTNLPKPKPTGPILKNTPNTTNRPASSSALPTTNPNNINNNKVQNQNNKNNFSNPNTMLTRPTSNSNTTNKAASTSNLRNDGRVFQFKNTNTPVINSTPIINSSIKQTTTLVNTNNSVYNESEFKIKSEFIFFD